MRQRPTWRRRVQDRVTIPGLIGAGLLVVLIIVLLVIGRTASSLGGSGSNGGGPAGSATPLFTPPGVSGVATPGSGSASAGSSPGASASSGTTSAGGTTQQVTFAPTATPSQSHGGTPPPTQTPMACPVDISPCPV